MSDTTSARSDTASAAAPRARRPAAIRPFAAALCALLAGGGIPARAQTPPAAAEIELGVLIAERQSDYERTLGDWVSRNTGSLNLAGLQAFAALLAQQLKELDFEVSVEPGGKIDVPDRGSIEAGPLVVGRRKARAPGAHPLRLLLVGHYDTVFEPDSPFQRMTRDANDSKRASGPGVADMKGGLIVMLVALRALRDAGDLDGAQLTVLFNGDEELGSLGSRARIETEARSADYGFVFESAQSDGAMVRSRSGVGQFNLTVHGVAAHAGNAHPQGRSAIRELASKILAIEALTNYDKGITLNVGTIEGGSKRNIVPDRATASIDVRYRNPEDGDAIRADLERIAAEHSVPGTEAELVGSLHRPPKPPDPRVEALLGMYTRVCNALHVDLPEPVHSGGGTDGSLMNAVGLATLDSMGVVGGRAHTEEEFIRLESLGERAGVSAALLRRLLDGEKPDGSRLPLRSPGRTVDSPKERPRR